MLTFALPKGRLLEESLGLLKRAGVILGNITDSRKLVHLSEDGSIRVLILRAKDVPTFVQNGGADLGIVGEDLLLEEPKDIYEVLRLPFGHCRLVVAEPEEGTRRSRGPLRIATKYPNITERFFSQKGIQFEVIPLYGSVELAPHAAIADLIVDLVSTGVTLKENRLREIQTIDAFSARLIVNRISFKTRYCEVISLLNKLRKVVDEELAQTT